MEVGLDIHRKRVIMELGTEIILILGKLDTLVWSIYMTPILCGFCTFSLCDYPSQVDYGCEEESCRWNSQKPGPQS